MSVMKQLSEYASDRLRLTREGFLQKYAVPVLLHRWDPSNDESDNPSTSAHISMIDLPPKGLNVRPPDSPSALGLSGKLVAAPDVVVLPIVKRFGAVLHDRVSVGRNRNADIHLPFRRISKFHAYFTAAAGGAKFMLTDAGSTNGTFISGKRIPTGQPVEISDKTLIQFSHFLFVFYSATGFYSLLSGESAAPP